MGTIEPPRFCSQCGNSVVVADASFCKNCGAPLSPSVWLSRNLSWRPVVAVVLSLIPGLGHWYKGERGRAVVWFASVVLLLAFASPVGMLLWLICALNAGLGGALRAEVLANSTGHRWRDQRNRWRHGSRQMPAQPPGW
jgi:hypothetical protein